MKLKLMEKYKKIATLWRNKLMNLILRGRRSLHISSLTEMACLLLQQHTFYLGIPGR